MRSPASSRPALRADESSSLTTDLPHTTIEQNALSFTIIILLVLYHIAVADTNSKKQSA